MINNRKKMFFLLIILCLCSFSNLCGVTLHNYVNNLSLTYFNINVNLKQFQAGSAFPDFGYDSPFQILYPDLPAASEIAHWLPFQFELLKYNLTSFSLGIVGHSVQDILWHNLHIIYPTGLGFMQTTCNVNYDCQGKDYNSTVHSLCDIGGEFVVNRFMDLSFLESEWDTPVEILSAIFKKFNLTVPAEIIQYSMDILFLEAQTMRNVDLDAVFDLYIKDKDFIVDQIIDWPVGGIYSMMKQTIKCWDSFLNNYTNICISEKEIIKNLFYGLGFTLNIFNDTLVVGDYENIYIDKNVFKGRSFTSLDKYLYFGNPGFLTNGYINVYDNNFKYIMTINGDTMLFGIKLFTCVDKLVVSDYTVGKIWIYKDLKLIKILNGNKFLWFGFEVLCFNDYMIISEIYNNTIYVYKNLTLYKVIQDSGNFGYNMVYDKHLIISSPTKYEDVIFGYQVGEVSFYDINTWEKIKTIKGEYEYGQFGYKIVSFDENLYVSSPYSGKIYKNNEIIYEDKGRVGHDMIIYKDKLVVSIPDYGKIVNIYIK